mmetsp:Transcript_597/g.892  ORF Transcript_597/g.892 Transcript_597/m.892 type:complete len:222 (-) Transcript_597:195-860(-)
MYNTRKDLDPGVSGITSLSLISFPRRRIRTFAPGFTLKCFIARSFTDPAVSVLSTCRLHVSPCNVFNLTVLLGDEEAESVDKDAPSFLDDSLPGISDDWLEEEAPDVVTAVSEANTVLCVLLSPPSPSPPTPFSLSLTAASIWISLWRLSLQSFRAFCPRSSSLTAAAAVGAVSSKLTPVAPFVTSSLFFTLPTLPSSSSTSLFSPFSSSSSSFSSSSSSS